MRRLLLLLVLSTLWLAAAELQAQSRYGSFLRRLDVNGNGRLDTSEIGDRYRSFLGRVAEASGLRLSESHSLDRWERAFREYDERRRRGDSDSRDNNDRDRDRDDRDRDAAPLVRGFGPDDETPVVPGFGADSVIRHQFIQEDLDDARRRLERDDRNRDGAIDEREAERARWSERNPFIYDYNGDRRLTLNELAQRYALRRIEDEREDAERDRRRREQSRDNGDDRRDQGRDDDDRRDRDDDRDRRDEDENKPGRGEYYLAQSVIERHDLNRNRQLDRSEWPRLGANAGQADLDRDGGISRDELAMWLFKETRSVARELPPELPGWFLDRDLNEDGQVTMAEFADQWSEEKAEEFLRYDRDDDGVIRTAELLSNDFAVGGAFADNKSRVILPRTTLLAEIEVEEDYLIGDLDVQLSITHTYADHLEAYLIGPDGQRVELFTGVGGNDDHFDGTILDDEATESIARSRPPFQGRFRPESADNREAPSLRHFYGQSVHGLWQLMIRSPRSDRSGMLHGWSLQVKPRELAQPLPESTRR